MATLTASKIKDTYKSLLKVGTTANSEITGSLKTIEDGNDNDTALQLSTAGVKSTGTLDVTGVTTLAAVTATTGSFSSTLGVTGLATFVNLTTTGTTTLGDASGDAVTINAATITLANDTNFVLSGGVNGVSFDTNVLSIDATNDRVGIGTTAPTGKLDVKSSTTNEVLFNAVINDGSDKRIASIVNTDGTNYGAFLVLGNAASPITSTITGGTIRFSGANGFDSWINNGGNVGIGTTSPGLIAGANKYLSIAPAATNGYSSALELIGTSVGVGYTTGKISFVNNYDGTQAYENARIEVIDGPSYADGGSIQFYTKQGGGPALAPVMRITNSGYVGIGTVAPLSKLSINGGLHVGGDSDAGDNNALIDGTLGVTGTATFDTDTFVINASTDQMLSRTSTAAINESTTQTGIAFNTNRLGDSVAGGLALTNNNYQLMLNRITAVGEHIRFCYAGAETGSISTNGSATSYNTTSDYRLKENIVSMQNALNNLIKLKPVNFNFINDKNFKVDGFIAHEVNEVVPAAVTGLKDAVYEEDGQPRYQSLDNSKLIPLIVAAIQELSAKVTALENK